MSCYSLNIVYIFIASKEQNDKRRLRTTGLYKAVAGLWYVERLFIKNAELELTELSYMAHHGLLQLVQGIGSVFFFPGTDACYIKKRLPIYATLMELAQKFCRLYSKEMEFIFSE